MSKRISLDDVLKNLQAQAQADWSTLENTENVIGGKSGVPAPQDVCHPPQQQE